MSIVLAIGDIHEPVSHPGYLQFCKDLYHEWCCDTVVFMGDIVDHHAVSAHAKNPMCPGALDEFTLAHQAIQKWHKAFPSAYVCIGNHDDRIMRMAAIQGIPATYLRAYSEIWNTPSWSWASEHVIDDVYYAHGTGQGGVHPAWNAAGKLSMSVVLGHSHSRAGVKWRANPLRRFFAVDVGCGIDIDAFQFAYGWHRWDRPILAAAVIRHGIPYHEVMPCGKGERYHKSQFKTSRTQKGSA